MTEADKRLLWSKMRVPVFAFVALMLMLSVNVLLGSFIPFRQVWIVEAAVVVCMILTVLLFSMELVGESPTIRFFAAVGFSYASFLFSMTMIDYFTR